MDLNPTNCPWASLLQSPLGFCEEVLCAFVKQPSNSWTNIGFFIVGMWAWRAAQREGHRHLRWIGIIAILEGTGSAFYHASGTHVGMLADYTGMFFGTSFVTALNVRRWLRCSFPMMYSVFFLMSLILLLIIWISPGNERLVFVLGSPCCLIELYLYYRDGKYIRYRHYLFVWIVFAVATFVWWLDMTSYACNPKNHFLTGHGIWHLLVASSFYFYYRYYAQFRLLKPSNNHDFRTG